MPASPQVLGYVVELLVCPIYTETNQLSMEFLFDPLACLKGNTTLTDKICIFWLSKTITFCKCHPDIELCGCQGNIMGDNLIAAVNCILSSPDVKPSLPEMSSLVLGYFIFRKQRLKKEGYLQSRRCFLLKWSCLGGTCSSGSKAMARQQRVCCALIISVSAGTATTLFR